MADSRIGANDRGPSDTVEYRDGPTVHPVVHRFTDIGPHGVDRLDDASLLTWEYGTQPHRLDEPEHALKVATRVRVPLGLPDLKVA